MNNIQKNSERINEAFTIAFNKIANYCSRNLPDGSSHPDIVFAIASACNRFGISQDKIITAAVRRYLSDVLNEEIIAQIVAAAYEEHWHEKAMDVETLIVILLVKI